MYASIGISVPFGLFTDSKKGAAEFIDAFGSREAFLEFCKGSFDSAELRIVSCDADPCVVLNAVKELKSIGLSVTIHGTLDSNFFAPYRDLFAANLQKCYNITVHPLATPEETEESLSKICAEIEENAYPVQITLENQRLKKGKSYGACADVCELVKKINSPHLSLCYDFGHQLSNERGGLEPIPGDEFLTRVRHTHIHSLEKRTHYPLNVGECLLDRNLTELLSRGYDGVLNLELSPERYHEELDVKESIVKSAKIIKAAIHQVSERLIGKAFYKNDYERIMRTAIAGFESADNCAMLIGPSAYALKLQGIRIAIDVTPKILPIGEPAKALLSDWISSFDAHIVTHSHVDHFDPKFINELPSSVKKIVPDFIPLQTEGRVTVTNGSEIALGNVSLSFYTSGHFLGSHGVPEYGIAIKSNGETLLFPTDVRDYDFVFPHFDNVRALFSHLWLGRGVALNFDELLLDKFCRFVKSFNAKECYVAHLVETSRDITNMWSDMHLDLVKKHIPEIKSPKIGELISLNFVKGINAQF